MRKFESALAALINYHHTSGKNFITNVDLDISDEILGILESKGLLRLTRYVDNAFRIDITPLGHNYFDDKAARCRRRWLDRLVGFISGVAISVAAGLIIYCVTGG